MRNLRAAAAPLDDLPTAFKRIAEETPNGGEATFIGAQLKIWSGPETGTEVELVVPGGTAYRAARDKSKRLWLRQFSGRNGETD